MLTVAAAKSSKTGQDSNSSKILSLVRRWQDETCKTLIVVHSRLGGGNTKLGGVQKGKQGSSG